MSTKREAVLAIIENPDEREFLSRWAAGAGITEDDERWEFIKLMREIPPEDRDTVFETIGRMSYGMTDEEIVEWKARINAQHAPLIEAIKTDMEFERAEKYASYAVEQATHMQSSGKSAKGVALEGLTQEARDRVIAEAASVGIVAEYDIAWLLVGAQIRCWAAAAAAGDAVVGMQSGIAGIPSAILEGAKKAGADIAGELRKESRALEKAILERGVLVQDSTDKKANAVLNAISDAANAGAEKIRTAALTLTDSLDKAVKAKADEGVHEWAKLAVGAGQIAARTALGKATRNAAIAMIFLFLLGVCAGAFGLELVRNFSGDYLPAGLRIYQAPGGDTLRVDPRKMLMQNAGLCGHDVCVPLVKNVRQPGQPAKP